ncbi:MAG TPA: hypothetical protein DD444_16760 [Citreicella sp.]|jgi:hypothetical protein|nr:hypothetical protein [Citreicella sp.]|tara:strand:- start:765 stop:959 length:195 start_codon:yes stop_codon:yes gene_type:complete
MTSIFALIVLCTTTLLVLGNLRMIAQDTWQALALAATRLRGDGHLGARTAFAALWILIFALSYQ